MTSQELIDKDNGSQGFDKIFMDLFHPNPHINKQACLTMIKNWPNQTLKRLLSYLDHPELQIRRKAVKALGQLGNEVFQPLVEVYHLTDNQVVKLSCLKVFVQASVMANSKPFPKEALEVIKLSLKEENPEIILTVIPLLKTLGEFGLSSLISLSRDQNILKSTTAILALGEVNNSLAERSIRDLYNDNPQDDLLYSAIEVALSKQSPKKSEL